MALLDDLTNEKNQYIALLSEVTNVNNSLGNAVLSIEPASNIQNSYRFNDYSADNSKIINEKRIISDHKDTISGKVIPEINNMISSLNQQIEAEEERIRQEEERRRREAEEAEAAAQAARNRQNES